MAALQTNGGRLAAYVGTINPNDSSPTEGTAGTGYGPAEVFLGNSGDPAVADATTTLTLTGVPEPGAMALLLAGSGTLFLISRARSHPSRRAEMES